MNATVRLWNETELQAAHDGTDLWLTTLLLNAGTLGEAMMRAYPYALRKSYSANVADENLKFYAPNDEMAIRFLNTQYTKWSHLSEDIIRYRRIEVTA